MTKSSQLYIRGLLEETVELEKDKLEKVITSTDIDDLDNSDTFSALINYATAVKVRDEFVRTYFSLDDTREEVVL